MEKDLIDKKKIGWKDLKPEDMKNIMEFSEDYMDFLNKSKTERLFVKNAKIELEKHGFSDIFTKESLKPGDKVYFVNNHKSMYIAVIGKEDIINGLNMIGSHVDSPRLDLKPNPIYEDSDFAYFKTHYYGGIKKYQWTTIPLDLKGVIVKTDGTVIDVNIGEDENDPVLVITDLLPHLAQEQQKETLAKAIKGENLNVLIGSIPDDEKEEPVKHNILKILNEKYGVVEKDFISAELEIVPHFKARTLGLDRSMVAGYGQDDKVCSFAALKSILNLENPEKTAVVTLVDKEEIGSIGNTSMESKLFDLFISEILNRLGNNYPSKLLRVYSNSRMLSADVDAGFDPIFPEVSEKRNAAFLGKGIVLNKYTGAGGKYSASDANAEYIAHVRNILEKNNINYQMSELGRIDLGGGGTYAYVLANKGMNVIDCGIPVLSMHSPYEVASKFDIYELYKAYIAFFRN